MNVRKFLGVIVDTVKEWQEDQAARLAAVLAYYTTFFLAPLLVIIIAIAGMLGGRDAAQGLVKDQVKDLIGRQGREFVGKSSISLYLGRTDIGNTFGAAGSMAQLYLNHLHSIE